MALPTEGLWEIRSGGNDLNGAGYKSTGGASADYTKQDAAELSITDLASDGAGTGLSTATGGVTAAMAGNYTYIESDGGFTPGYYQITVVTDGNNFTIDRSAGADLSAGKGKIGGGRATWTDAFFEGVQIGDTIWVEDGSYTLPGALSIAKVGTTALPIRVRGYKTTRGDEPTGDDRPSVDCQAQYMGTGAYWIFEHLQFTGSNTSMTLAPGQGSWIKNCKIVNTAGSGTPVALYLSSYIKVVDCWIETTLGYCVNPAGGCLVAWNVLKGGVEGIHVLGAAATIVSNIIKDATSYGINLATYYFSHFLHNSIYNCDKGIYLTTGYGNTFYNNQIVSCTTRGFEATSTSKTNVLDYNNWYGNGDDISGASKGLNATANDPGWVNPAGDDFSGVDDAAGVGIRLGVG